MPERGTPTGSFAHAGEAEDENELHLQHQHLRIRLRFRQSTVGEHRPDRQFRELRLHSRRLVRRNDLRQRHHDTTDDRGEQRSGRRIWCVCRLSTSHLSFQLVVQGQTVQDSDYTRWYSSTNTEQGTSFHLGSITSGQSKDFLLPLGSISASNCEVLLTYDTVLEKKKVLQFDTKSLDPRADRRLIEQQKFRLELVHCVRTVFEAKRQNDEANPQLEAAMNQMKALETKLGAFAASSETYVKDLLADLTGQVHEAITRADWFKKWGVHFLPSLTRRSRTLSERSSTDFSLQELTFFSTATTSKIPAFNTTGKERCSPASATRWTRSSASCPRRKQRRTERRSTWPCSTMPMEDVFTEVVRSSYSTERRNW